MQITKGIISMKVRRYFTRNYKRAIAFLLLIPSLLGFVACFETMLEDFIAGFTSSFDKVLKHRIAKQNRKVS